MLYEAAAVGVLHVNKKNTQMNLACLFAKVFLADRREELLGSILWTHEYRERPWFPATWWCRYLLREWNSWAQYAGALIDFAILMKSELRGLFNAGHTVGYNIGRRQPYWRSTIRILRIRKTTISLCVDTFDIYLLFTYRLDPLLQVDYTSTRLKRLGCERKPNGHGLRPRKRSTA